MIFGHFNGDRLQLVFYGVAAEISPAYAEPSNNFCLVPGADLPEFNSSFEHRGKVLYQLSEIHAAISGEVEYDLLIVEKVVNADELHIEFMLFYLLKSYFKGIFLFPLIITLFFQIFLCTSPQYFAYLRILR